MANCKYCHKPIERFDRDICPHCGAAHPLDDSYETMDITRTFSLNQTGEELYHSRSKKTALILGFLLGPFGAMWFYLLYKKAGVIQLLISLIGTLGIGFLLFFTCMNNALAFLLPLFVFYLISWVFAIRLSLDVSPKDGNGELLR